MRAGIYNAMPDEGVALQGRRPLVDAASVHLVSPQWAARVVSPLHDVLSDTNAVRCSRTTPTATCT